MRFATAEGAQKAMEYNNRHMGSRWVDLDRVLAVLTENPEFSDKNCYFMVFQSKSPISRLLGTAGYRIAAFLTVFKEISQFFNFFRYVEVFQSTMVELNREKGFSGKKSAKKIFFTEF